MNIRKYINRLCVISMICTSLSAVAQDSFMFQGHVSDDFFQRAVTEYELVPFKKSDSSYKIVTHSHRKGKNVFYASHSACQSFQKSVHLCIDPIENSQDICRFEVYHIGIQSDYPAIDPDHNIFKDDHIHDDSSKLYTYGAGCIIGCAGVYALYKYMSRHK